MSGTVTEPEEVENDVTTDQRPSGQSGVRRGPALAVVVALLVVAAGAGWWWTERSGDDEAAPPSERAAVLTVARQVATNFFMLDHASIDDDIAAVSALATGDFAEAYAQQAPALKADVTKRELVVTAQLPEDGTAVESLADDVASVLVSVDATSTPGKGSDAGKSQLTLYRVRVTLTRTDGAWLASRLDQVEVGEVADDGAFTAGEFVDVPGDQAVVQVAADGLDAALSYDYRDLDAGLDRAVATMTDDFAAEFRDTFTTSAGRLARRTRAVADAVVRGAGLVRHDDGAASVLVYVDQILVSSETTKDADAPLLVNQSRVLVDLRRVDDAWLIDGIQPF